MNTKLSNSRTKAKRLFVVEKDQMPAPTCPKEAVTAIVGREITFNPTVLDTFDVEGFLPVHYDLLVLCAAIEFAESAHRAGVATCT